jgi:hypothetical protein
MNKLPIEDVLHELASREPIFHRPEVTTREEVNSITTEDFWEIGASGRIYDRQFVADELERRHKSRQPPESYEVSGFRCHELGPDTYLLTYTLIQNQHRHTRRSTIWRHSADGWKIVFHQGTLVEP